MSKSAAAEKIDQIIAQATPSNDAFMALAMGLSRVGRDDVSIPAYHAMVKTMTLAPEHAATAFQFGVQLTDIRDVTVQRYLYAGVMPHTSTSVRHRYDWASIGEELCAKAFAANAAAIGGMVQKWFTDAARFESKGITAYDKACARLVGDVYNTTSAFKKVVLKALEALPGSVVKEKWNMQKLYLSQALEKNTEFQSHLSKRGIYVKYTEGYPAFIKITKRQAIFMMPHKQPMAVADYLNNAEQVPATWTRSKMNHYTSSITIPVLGELLLKARRTRPEQVQPLLQRYCDAIVVRDFAPTALARKVRNACGIKAPVRGVKQLTAPKASANPQ